MMASILTDQSSALITLVTYGGDHSCANNVRVRLKKVEDANVNESNLAPQTPDPQHDLESLTRFIQDDSPAREGLRKLAHILDHMCMLSSANEQQPSAKQGTQVQLKELLSLVKDNPSAQGAFGALAQFILNHLSPQPTTDSQKSDRPKLAPDLPCVNCKEQAVLKLDNNQYECTKCGARTFKPRNRDNNLSLPSTADTQKAGKPKLASHLFGHHSEEQGVAIKRTDLCEIGNDSTCNEVAQTQEPTAQKPSKRFLPLQPPPVCINSYLTILLIGYDEAVTRMLKLRFSNEGFLVRCAYDAENGFRVYESSRPFVLVMVDFSLPHSGGIKLSKAIRQSDHSQRMVITAFSYRTQEEVERPLELTDVPVLTDVCQLPSLLDSLRPWANRDEVKRATEGLTQADLCRIRKEAERKGWRDWEDLLQETLLRALTGADDAHNGKRKNIRRWDKRIDFVKFLTGSMQSINYHQKKKPDNDEHLKKQALNLESYDLTYEALVVEKFNDDHEATNVLQDSLCGMNDDEIKSKRSLSYKQLAAIKRRIRSELLDGSSKWKGEEHDLSGGKGNGKPDENLFGGNQKGEKYDR